jgi:hypothetical protein
MEIMDSLKIGFGTDEGDVLVLGHEKVMDPDFMDDTKWSTGYYFTVGGGECLYNTMYPMSDTLTPNLFSGFTVGKLYYIRIKGYITAGTLELWLGNFKTLGIVNDVAEQCYIVKYLGGVNSINVVGIGTNVEGSFTNFSVREIYINSYIC